MRIDKMSNLRQRKNRQNLKFGGLSYVAYQKTHGVQLGKICNPLDRLKGTDRLRIPSDVHQDSDAHPIVCRFRAHHDPILAIANEDGLIEIIDTTRHTLRPRKAFTLHKSMISDIAWLSSHHLLSATCPPHNQLGVLDVERGEEIWAKCKLHKGSVKVVAGKPQDADVFASGGRDGDIIVYDRRTDGGAVLRIEGAHPKKASGARKSSAPKTSQGAYGITSLNFRDANHLISTASGGGHVLVWDLRRSYNLLREPRPFLRLATDGGTLTASATTAAASGLNGFVGASTGGNSAGGIASNNSTTTINNSSHLATSSNENTAFTYAIACPFRKTLYAQCSDNVIYAFDINVYADKPVSIFYGHNAGRGEGAYFIKMDVSPSGRFLAIGSPRMDEFCEEQPIPIFDTTRPGPPLCVLKGHYAEPTCPAWCTDLKLASCGDDQQLILWEPVGIDDDIKTWGYCDMLVETKGNTKPLSDKLARLHEMYNMPNKGDSTPRVSRALRCNTRSISDWLKSSPASPMSSPLPGSRSPLTPLRTFSSQIATPTPPIKRLTPHGGHAAIAEDADTVTCSAGNRSATCSPTAGVYGPHTPKRRKLATPRSKPITGFFAREKAAESVNATKMVKDNSVCASNDSPSTAKT